MSLEFLQIYIHHLITGSSSVQVPVMVELSYARLSGTDTSIHVPGRLFVVGSVQLTSSTGWMELEGILQSVLANFFLQLDTGLKTKKTSRLDPEITSDSAQYSLGLGPKAIQHYSIGTIVCLIIITTTVNSIYGKRLHVRKGLLQIIGPLQ